MATTVQHKRGTAAQVAAYVAVQGEIVMDTTNTRLLFGDGTLGGVSLAKVSDVTAASAASSAALTTTIEAMKLPSKLYFYAGF